MEDGLYRVVFPKGRVFEAARVEDDRIFGVDPVYEGDPVSEMLAEDAVFMRVYPLNLPEYMMEWVHSQALVANVEDDDVIEEAIRRFMQAVKKREA